MDFVNDFSFKGKQDFGFGGVAFKGWVLEFFEFLCINQNDIDSLFKLIDDSSLEIFVARFQSFAVAGPGGMDINN